jgi:septal ring factor EnvC (AmiA/AmiB activator)
MLKYFFCLIFCFTALFSFAQKTREELEKERNDLKREMDEMEKLLKANKNETKASYVDWQMISKKVNLQDRVIENLNKDLRVLDNNMYTIQKDINRYDRVLDTLKEEYAKSMVYAYKNRSNYDFLNFIFSAENFNDAIKRVAYLKSYRSYREMQGQNILRTQNLRKQRIEDLGGAKVKKNTTLQVQSKEMQTLEEQKKEKDRILADLQKQGKQLSNQMAAKQKQMKKVNGAITAAIKRAQDEARKAALAKAAEDERRRKEADRLAAKNNTPATNPATNPTTSTTKTVKTPVAKSPAKKVESILLNDENIALNNSFEKNRGSLPWPVDNGGVSMHFGNNPLPDGGSIVTTCTTIATAIGTPVKAIFDGEVVAAYPNDEQPFVVIQHGKYFTTYTNLSGVTVSKGQQVKYGQVLGKVAAGYDGRGSIDFYMSNESSSFDAEKWLRRR